MFTLTDERWPTRHISRRNLLQAGTLAACGLSLPGLLARQAAAASSRGRGKSVIMIWLRGGPSHIDSYDMKPDAPAEIRGEFQPIATNVPGIQICEHLPLHGRDHGQAGDRPRHPVERPRRPHAALHPHRLPRPRQAARLRLGRQLPAAREPTDCRPTSA